MKKYLVALLLLLTVSTANAQTLKHEFEDYTVYIELGEHFLETWRVDENRQCTMYPSTIELEGNEIFFPAGTVWKVKKLDSAIEITFPNGKVVKYKSTDVNPRKKCGLIGKDT